MNAFNMAKTAYSAPSAPVRTARGLEYDVFTKVTHKLKLAASEDSFNMLVAALQDNSKLWTLMAASVADSGNALPETLRARIFYLSEFVAHQTRLVLRKEAGVDALVDVNTAVMSGLRGMAGAV
jgi:flagellar protein FlaF